MPEASILAGVKQVPTFHFIKDNQLVAELAIADEQKLNELIAQYR